MDAKCRWRSDWLDGAVRFREPLGQTKVMQIRQGEAINHQGAVTNEVCCLAAQYIYMSFPLKYIRHLTFKLLFTNVINNGEFEDVFKLNPE